MNNIEILRSGFSDSLDILKTEEMDFICGGDTDCKKNYSLSNNGTTISCGENDPFDDAECRQCKVLPICGGGCPIDRKKGENKGQKSYCSIYKKYIEEMLPLIYENQNRNSKL